MVETRYTSQAFLDLSLHRFAAAWFFAAAGSFPNLLARPSTIEIPIWERLMHN